MSVANYPVPSNESERLIALHSYDILDSMPEEQFNAITRLTAYICQVPFAFITFIDKDRQWFKALVGMDIESIPRADSFCNYTIADDKIHEVNDASVDERFADHANVKNGGIMYYAGAPLIDPDGYHLGSLCVFDTKPRKLTDEQRDALTTLAGEVISHLVLRKQKKELEETLIWHHEFYNLFNSSPEIHCITDRALNILLINQAVENILGYKAEDIEGKPIWRFFNDDKRDEMLLLIKNNGELGTAFELETPVRTVKGLRWISWTVKPNGERWYASGRDVTIQKRDEAQLEMLSLVASKVSNGIVISDGNDNVVWTNDSFEEITGYSLADVRSKPLRNVLNGKLGANISVKDFEELLASRQSYEVDLNIKRKDGKDIWISVMNSVIKNERGEVERQIRGITDITQRKETEKDLEILSSAVRKSPSGILIRDAERRIVWMNEALEKITGYTLEEMKGKPFGEMLIGPETDVSAFEKAVALMAENKPYSIEILIYRKDGSQVWTYLHNSPYFNANGEVERNILIAIDITERKKTEQQLAYLSLVASNTLSGVVINSADGRVEWVNSAFTSITGYNFKDVKGKHLGDALKGELTDVGIIEKSRELSRNKQSFEVDLLAYRKDGKPVWLSVINSVILGADGLVDKYIEVLIDITSKKKAETELISAKEEALQLSKAKDMFISVMSHEIRTPLNAVVGMSHLLMEDNPTESQEENLSILKFSAENLLKLINEVLDFAKMDSGNLELEKVKVNLPEMIHNIIASLQYNISGKGIYLKENIDSDVPKFILGDKTRLTQILINLVNNAVKFTETGGVTVELKVIEQSAKDVRIRFAVTDTGIGIAKDKLGTIFESFKQAELNTTRKYGGTGLGLAITKRLIELHDSRIIVDSVLGKGSTFWFTITFKKVDGAEAENTGSADAALNLHALVVDDNQINRLLINKVLKKWGATADFAEDGLQAIQKIESDHSFDVVLMDIHMPVMGGLEATKTLRAKDESYYKQLPIIALTASMLNNQMGEISEAGMNDYVLKPFDPKVLHDKLSKYQKQ
ncbi:PAS domain S-box protein [Mucilaginibacter ginkgonis]|uniref:histidine kinase n=1 Tax=Mucilaginibacter ginkgonis TaxID=2682091 RepID=A0A6I4I114_9SPHI|nr:PAS domain S-box protein [Mucilaginibacter ginkgonis]QQL48800.1 PAS domain S-box protein [Mucilaginibacter ginkgonis]